MPLEPICQVILQQSRQGVPKSGTGADAALLFCIDGQLGVVCPFGTLIRNTLVDTRPRA